MRIPPGVTFSSLLSSLKGREGTKAPSPRGSCEPRTPRSFSLFRAAARPSFVFRKRAPHGKTSFPGASPSTAVLQHAASLRLPPLGRSILSLRETCVEQRLSSLVAFPRERQLGQSLPNPSSRVSRPAQGPLEHRRIRSSSTFLSREVNLFDLSGPPGRLFYFRP